MLYLGSVDNLGKKQYVAERTWQKEEKCQEYLPKIWSSTCSSSLSSVSEVQHLTFLESQLQVRSHLRYVAYIVAQSAKNLPAVQETRVPSLAWEDTLEKEMATHSSILAWKISQTEEPGGLQFIGLQSVGHDGRYSVFQKCWLRHQVDMSQFPCPCCLVRSTHGYRNTTQSWVRADMGAESLVWVPAQPFLSLNPGEGELKPVPT